MGIGSPRAERAQESDRAKRHVVVIGGSLAGLLAAHVLKDHAGSVTVVERDRYPDGPEHRPGVPQDRHAHLFLKGGADALEELLPGLPEELLEHGAPRLGMPTDILQRHENGWIRRTPASTHVLTGSRPLADWLVRRRVLADPRITVLEGTEVTGLVGDAARIRGVQVRARGAGQETRTLTADLVLDASGRSSRAPAWLRAIGAEPPHEETIDAGLAYATRFYRAGPGTGELTYRAVYMAIDGTQPRGGILAPVEGDRWIALLSGFRGNEPPTDEAGYLDFAASLPHPMIREWLEKAEPLTPIHGFRKAANVRRRYDLPGRRPAGFLATGEALCAFNPVYGQGMSVAALCAVALRDTLDDPRRTPTTRRVQRALAAVARQAWDISTGGDRAVPGVTGNAVRPRAIDRPIAWYLNRVIQRVPGNPVVGDAFREVGSLAAPNTKFFAPKVLRAVLFSPVPAPLSAPPLLPETPET
ncbi:FAD-dependent oxidoreductase [Streptomyces sp. AV19]|uniref:NAD(P)/FAD-dependent oxidoreductase n=1 Tax=Streptomyces sp. AV19 TaxID=2793068 RepID=UPI0018FE505B|nr:FAD-dependent oxidoreductase [Streptomyces sp. AV19]MBH1934147.1 FAD-dependent oxidoreductase [Streptomyces sp. AV19]MDG4533672.1 FAD-dependent oxidoreductase [Streptomyces sp. AV19]